MENPMMDTKRLLFLLRQSPYGSSHALEALETVLVAGVFEQRVSVLFCDEGVWQLVSDQNGALVNRRTVGRVVQALPPYDVAAPYVCSRSLAERGLTVHDLTVPVTVI